MKSNRRKFLASIVALFGVRKTTVPLSEGVYLQWPIFEDPWNQSYVLKPRSAGTTTVSAALINTYQIPYDEYLRSLGGPESV
jgi:hypothetical protein